MADLDPRKLLYLASIVELGSLNKAARVHNISQPALSTSMDRLEQALGVQLLNRTPRGIVPTSYGEILYCHARLVREEMALALRDLMSAKDRRPDAIRVGALPSLAGSVVPMALGRWRESYPNRELEVVENAQFDLLTGLLRRDFDFVIGMTEVYDMLNGLRQQVLFRDLLCVIARHDHPLVGQPNLCWEALAAYPWISPTSRRTHTVLENVMNSTGVRCAHQITVCGSVSLLKSLVAESDHLALLPAHAASTELAEGRLIALPFEHEVLRRNIAVFFRDGYDMDEPRQDLIAAIKQFGIKLSREQSGSVGDLVA